ncbi:Arylphorin subunit C223 [Lucilia cuprina]|nr:Arylphorin subunit C223 [Lucilia cuprina]
MKIAIVLLAIVGLVAASSISKHDVKVADKEFLAKQKFLFEIVYRVEDPLIFEEWIKLGKSFDFDKADYTHFDFYMEKFYEAYKHDALLPKGEFFGALVQTHLKQAYGLFEFFYYAKNWEVFQRNVAFARMHCNEGMFVYALTLAVIHRDDFQGLILPSIYEIFPQYFFNSKFVLRAEEIRITMSGEIHPLYENGIQRISLQGLRYLIRTMTATTTITTPRGISRCAMEHFFCAKTSEDTTRTLKILGKSLKGTHYQMFFMLLTNTRDVEFFTKESALSYFTEDGWASTLTGTTLTWITRSLGWQDLTVWNKLSSFVSRLLVKFPNSPTSNTIEYGYNPQLVYYNGVVILTARNYYEVEKLRKFDYYYKVMDSSTVWMKSSAKVINGKACDTFVQILLQYCKLPIMYFGFPIVLLEYDHDAYKHNVRSGFRLNTKFFYYVTPLHLTRYCLTLRSWKLVTFFVWSILMSPNLLTTRSLSSMAQSLDKTCCGPFKCALNHQTLSTLISLLRLDKNKVVRALSCGPKYDDSSWVNELKRSSKNFYWTSRKTTSYTELYKYVMLAFEGKYEIPLGQSANPTGMPMQFFFYVTPFTAEYEQFSTFDYKYSCGIGSGVRYVDEMPFGYPFDREIDEYEFFVPNMYFKDVKIYHKDTFEKYFEHKYENFGHFDYKYFH